MWRWLVRPRVVAMFEAVSAADTSTVVAGLARDVEHRFAGDHALSGTRIGPVLVTQWFGRLHRLFPQLDFDLGSVEVSGPPWDLHVSVEWVAHVVPAAGASYENTGAHLIRIRRGRVMTLHAYEDSQAVARACEAMTQAGISEAGAPPITGGSTGRTDSRPER